MSFGLESKKREPAQIRMQDAADLLVIELLIVKFTDLDRDARIRATVVRYLSQHRRDHGNATTQHLREQAVSRLWAPRARQASTSDRRAHRPG